MNISYVYPKLIEMYVHLRTYLFLFSTSSHVSTLVYTLNNNSKLHQYKTSRDEQTDTAMNTILILVALLLINLSAGLRFLPEVSLVKSRLYESSFSLLLTTTYLCLSTIKEKETKEGEEEVKGRMAQD